MEFLVVNESKLKIILKKEDTEKYGVDCNSSESAKNRRAFFEILAVAKEEVSFDISDDKVLIQFYPTQDGGCEVFVTKLGLLSGSAVDAINRSHKVTMLSRNYDFFSVVGYDELLSLCFAISRVRCPASEVYKSSEGVYYLALESQNSSSTLGEFPFIGEFAQRVKRDGGWYIKEHCERLYAKDAVRLLAKKREERLSRQ